jgi:glycosyltransferase involved in cell wall biosynthesis
LSAEHSGVKENDLPTPLKVLFVNHTGIVSGGERVLLLILDNLNKDRFAATVSCPQKSELAEMVAVRNIPVVDLPVVVARFTWNPVKLFRYLRSYFNAIREFRNSPSLESADIVHANSVRAGLLVSFAMMGKRTPVIWHVHDQLKSHPISSAVRLTAFFLPPFSVIAVSRATAKGFKGLLLKIAKKHVPVVVIQNPVDTERFRPIAEDRVKVRQELNLGEEQFAFASIGQLTPRKGQLDTIRAFKELTRTAPNAVLLIVGSAVFEHDHSYAELLRQEVTDSKLETQVLFLGQRSDVNAVLAAADAVVINSRREPFSLLALEALAAGKPVVAAAVDGLPELLTDGETGLLVRPDDVAALVSAMLRLIAEPELCKKLGTQGRPYVEKKFTCERFIGELEKLYLQVPAGTSAAPSSD